MNPNKFTLGMFRLRWLLAPIYIGLSFALIALGYKFFQETLHLLAGIHDMKEDQMVLIILALVDIAMVGGLIVTVMLSGFENFIGKFDLGKENRQLEWLGKLDAASLKAKISASIVAISSIHLLQIFMEAPTTDNWKIGMYIALHMTFVASAYIMGMLDIKTKATDPTRNGNNKPKSNHYRRPKKQENKQAVNQ